MNPRDRALRDLDALYAHIPAIACRGLCVDSCTVVDGSPLERERLAEHGVGIGPRPGHRQLLALIADGRTPRCPALSALGTCRVYSVRPAVCRLFGAADGLLCEHGCTPERVMTRAEAFALLLEADAISTRVDGRGDRG